MKRLNHPFIVNMYCAFQDTENLYLVMDYVNGGDLRYHMGNKKRFPEQETRFVVACILTSLAYLHLNNVIHRDLKPENLVYDRDGYVRLTDLGVSRAHKLNNSSDTSGTPGYMAPEVICRKDHSFPCDFFALGVICYEMMLGRVPSITYEETLRRQESSRNTRPYAVKTSTNRLTTQGMVNGSR